jgi:hypothetical protein
MTDQPTSPDEIFGSDRMWGLKELPLAEPVSWWPQTSGWAVLAALVLAGLVWAGHKLWCRYERNAYRRQGLASLEAMASDIGAPRDLPFLLRKSALQAASRHDVAGLRGDDWIGWLNASAGRTRFRPEDGEMLARLTYAGQSDEMFDAAAVEHLIAASKDWMRSHRAAV